MKLTHVLVDAGKMAQGAVNHSIQILHQLQRKLEGQTPAQGNNAPDATPGDAVWKGVNIARGIRSLFMG